jgi:hypothetical protein
VYAVDGEPEVELVVEVEVEVELDPEVEVELLLDVLPEVDPLVVDEAVVWEPVVFPVVPDVVPVVLPGFPVVPPVVIVPVVPVVSTSAQYPATQDTPAGQGLAVSQLFGRHSPAEQVWKLRQAGVQLPPPLLLELEVDTLPVVLVPGGEPPPQPSGPTRAAATNGNRRLVKVERITLNSPGRHRAEIEPRSMTRASPRL